MNLNEKRTSFMKSIEYDISKDRENFNNTYKSLIEYLKTLDFTSLSPQFKVNKSNYISR